MQSETLLCQGHCVGANSTRIQSFFHDLQMEEDSASLFLLATIHTLEDKITSARMYSCSFHSIQPVCDIANTFYWINYIYSHELRCECTATSTEYTTSSASGTWSRVSFCYPLYTINIYYDLGEATSIHCPEILLLHKAYTDILVYLFPAST